MPESVVLAPTAEPEVFLAPNGQRVRPPAGWARLPPGDALLTRRVKLAGPSWAVLEKKGRKTFSKGIWAPYDIIVSVRAAIDAERSTEGYAEKLAADRARRQKHEAQYAEQFEREVETYLRFAGEWTDLGKALAKLVAEHATPVGSGTVARTKRIPVEDRAAAAVIAWMRHQTTAYDDMKIPRVKGARREVRRELARIARSMLDLHRHDTPHPMRSCALCTAVVAAHAG